MAEKLYLPYSSDCFVCGRNNPYGLRIAFYTLEDKVHIDITLDYFFNSYVNVAHGGVLSALLDEAMGWAAFIFSDQTTFFFTRELSVTYKKNVGTGVPLLITTEFVGMERGGMASAKGKITDLEGNVYTTSKGLFFPVAPEKMAETKTYLKFDDDKQYHPKALQYCR